MATAGEHTNQPSRKRPLTELYKPTTVFCTVVAIDHKNLFYRTCKECGKALPENGFAPCRFCSATNRFNPSTSGSKRLFSILLSISTDSKISVVIMFDRAARVLFGCSANDFFDFAKTHPHAAEMASKVLEGEMLSVTLSQPKNKNAQHMRVSSVVPMRTDFQPAINTLRELYSKETQKPLAAEPAPLPGTVEDGEVMTERGREILKEVAPANSNGHALGQVHRGSRSDLCSSSSEARIRELEARLKEKEDELAKFIEERTRKEAEHAKFVEEQARRDAREPREIRN